MTLLEKLKLLRTIKGVGFKDIIAGNIGLFFTYDNKPVYLKWDDLIYELETLELYRTYATVKESENEEY